MTYSLDANHHDLVEAFKKLGCKIVDNAKVKRYEKGVLDIWVGIPNPYGDTGIWVYVEIKYLDNAPTPEQKEEIGQCREKGLPVETARDTADVERIYHKYLAVMYANGA